MLAAAPDVAAAVPLALAVLEAVVPLADLESDLDSDLESALVVFDAAADAFVGDALDEVVDASAWHINYRSWRHVTTQALTIFRTILPP